MYSIFRSYLILGSYNFVNSLNLGSFSYLCII